MERAYIICIVIGIGVPLVSLVLGSLLEFIDGLFDGIANFFDGLDFDLDLSIDVGDAHICFIPLSTYSICAGLLLFGGMGYILYNGSNLLFANVIAVLVAYVAAAAVQTLVYKLKQVDHSPVSQDELLYCQTVVVSTILAGGFGSVSIRKADGTTVNYPARAYDPEEEIRQNTEVNILKFDRNTAIVKKTRVTSRPPLEF